MAESSSSSELLPSSYDGDYWIYASNKTAENCMAPGENCGKWLIFTSAAQVDAEWEKVRQATEVGQLGFQSKVATAKDTPRNNNFKPMYVTTGRYTLFLITFLFSQFVGEVIITELSVYTRTTGPMRLM